jgi:hypothetical protein
VLPPVIMSTIAIIISFTPLFFITGMMGPYMGPMASNVPMTVIFSTLCALTIVPWMTYLLLKNHPVTARGRQRGTAGRHRHPHPSRLPAPGCALSGVPGPARTGCWRHRHPADRAYRSGVFRLVPLKMLPFDNKNEFQIVVDMPEGTTLEATDAVVRQFENYLRGVPEVTIWSPCRQRLTHRFQRIGAPLLPEKRVLTWPTSGSTWRQKPAVRSKATPSCCGCARTSSGSPMTTGPTSSWWKRPPDRRCSPRWWPKSMATRMSPTGN